ncbi:MAG: helix-turn-helix transcriptional regulator [Thermogutta sp.]
MLPPRSETDLDILDYLRTLGPMSVAELAKRFEVTPTAIRQRLGRLLAEGVISRQLSREGRGRPHYAYVITSKGEQSLGSNYAELAVALWRAIQTIGHPETRRQVWQRAAEEMVKMHLPQVKGRDIIQRMADVVRILRQKREPFCLEQREGAQAVTDASPVGPTFARRGEQSDVSMGVLPLLVAEACPYPELSERDPEICELERLWLSKLLDVDVKLDQCRRNGDPRCCFQPAPNVTTENDSRIIPRERVQVAWDESIVKD